MLSSMTEVYKVDPMNPDRSVIKRAAEVIRGGGLVAFPTETVYGLAADALNAEAVKKIFVAKGRPRDNPLIVHIADVGDVQRLAEKVPREAEALIKRFFPGPLTIVLEKKPIVPDETTANLNTLAVRMPDHKVALSLIREARTPIAAPSANTAGRPSPTKAQHVLDDLYGKVDVIIDGGETRYGLESTVVDLTVSPPQILRPGVITFEMLRSVLDAVQIHPAALHRIDERKVVAKSPGMRYRHYAPDADLVVIVGCEAEVKKKIKEMIQNLKMKDLRVGVATTTGEDYQVDHVEELGRSKREIAKRLFDALRRLDKAGVDVILAEGVDEEGLGLAIMNRLKKASGYNIIKV